MNIEEIVEYINRLTPPRLLRFVSEKGENSCRECLKYHDQIFEENDKNMPHIPLHPNCQCKYELVGNQTEKIIKAVDQKQLFSNILQNSTLTKDDAQKIVMQITHARVANPELKNQALFLLFNGRYLVSSDGSLVLNAVSGKPVSEKYSSWSKKNMIGAEQIVTRTFNYSYERQGLESTGGIPEGIYYILQSETRSIITSPVSHLLGCRGWGSYSWSLHPCENTNTRKRTGFFIHGGSESTSAGCIDLREHDITFNIFLHHSAKKKLYICIIYPEVNVSVSEKNLVLPAYTPESY